MTQEALKLAIHLRDTASGYWTEHEIPIIEKLIEILAQPEQEPVATLFGSLPVYDTTPPQRTWVGLTGEEIDSYFEDHGWSPSESYYPVIKDIEAKLKQKNGYAEEENT